MQDSLIPPCEVFHGPQSILDLSKPTSFHCSHHAHGLLLSLICLTLIPKPLVFDTENIMEMRENVPRSLDLLQHEIAEALPYLAPVENGKAA